MVPVIKAKGHVAILLNFEDHYVPKSVHRSRLAEDRLARLWRKTREQIDECLISQPQPQTGCGRSGLQPRIDPTLQSRLAGLPMLLSSRFRLPAEGSCPPLWGAPGLRAFRETSRNFSSQREPLKLVGQPSPSFAQETASSTGRSFALQWSIGYLAGMVIAVAE